MNKTYTPFILDRKILQFDDDYGLLAYDIPSIMFTKKLEVNSENSNKLELQPQKESEDVKENLTVILPKTTQSDMVMQVSNTVIGNHVFTKKMNVGHMDALLNEAAKFGIFFRVTSGVRPGAKTKQGKISYHALGQAIDITPIKGETYADLKQKIKNSPEFVKWMQEHGYGIFDETTPEVMKKTGATGPHWHIGKDRSAIRGLQRIIES